MFPVYYTCYVHSAFDLKDDVLSLKGRDSEGYFVFEKPTVNKSTVRSQHLLHTVH